MRYVSPFQGLGEMERRRIQGDRVRPRVALRSTLGYLIMPLWGDRSGYGSVFKKLGDCPRVFWLFILLVPKRSFLAGFVKSPNRWRWLAHDAVDLGRQRRKSAVCLTSSK